MLRILVGPVNATPVSKAMVMQLTRFHLPPNKQLPGKLSPLNKRTIYFCFLVCLFTPFKFSGFQGRVKITAITSSTTQ